MLSSGVARKPRYYGINADLKSIQGRLISQFAAFCNRLVMNIPIIHTDRLLLRPFYESDFNEFAKMNADPQVVAFLGDGQPVDRKESWRILAWLLGHWQLRGYGSWAIE